MASMTAADYEDYVVSQLIYFARSNGIVCQRSDRTKSTIIRKLTTKASFTQQQFDDFWARDDVRNDPMNPMHPGRPKTKSRSKKLANARDDDDDDDEGEDDEEEGEQDEDDDEDQDPLPAPSRKRVRSNSPAQQAPIQPTNEEPAHSIRLVPTEPMVRSFMTRPEIYRSVTPHLMKGMKYLAKNEPEKPLKWLSEFLARRSAELREGEERFEEFEGGAKGNTQQRIVAHTADRSEDAGEGRVPGEEDRCGYA